MDIVATVARREGKAASATRRPMFQSARNGSSTDFVDKLTQLVHDGHPYSWKAAAISIACLAIATLLRAAFGSAAAHLPLTFYILAILSVELLAGFPAAIATAVSSVIIVWWAFIPPYFQFVRPEFSEIPLLLLFATESGAAILIGYWCRIALIRLHRHQVAHQTVARELAHRSKNSLALFEVIVRRSLGSDIEHADAILGRMRALDYANDLLVRENSRDVSLQDVLKHEMAPFGPERILARGPEIAVPAARARHLLLIVHELVTNAAKYGALSNRTGRVAVHWRINGDRVILNWKEHGGPVVEQPKRSGFGTTVMSQGALALAGRLTPIFLGEGFTCVLEFKI
jgi:two-component sensor histidine kinase